MLLRIGGHTVEINGECAERFLSHYGGAKPFIVEDTSPEWTVRFGVELPDASGNILNRFIFSEIGSECVFSRNSDTYHFEMYETTSRSRLVGVRYCAGEYLVEATDCNNNSALRFALWFAYSMLAAQASTTFVHSSVIVYKGDAVLFLGESGTGKSTHTSLWLKNIDGAHLLNDDSPVLAIEGGEPVVYGSPWSGKTPCYFPYRFPLAAVVRLSQAKENRIRRLSIPEALGAMHPSLPPALMQDEFFSDFLIDIISSTIVSVPAFHLDCLPDNDAARLSCQTIFG